MLNLYVFMYFSIELGKVVIDDWKGGDTRGGWPSSPDTKPTL
jgi:hypothetical protein